MAWRGGLGCFYCWLAQHSCACPVGWIPNNVENTEGVFALLCRCMLQPAGVCSQHAVQVCALRSRGGGLRPEGGAAGRGQWPAGPPAQGKHVC